MSLFGRVITSDQTGQHGGVRGFWLPSDQGQADAWLRLHGEAAQDLDMRVARAQQDNIGFDRPQRLHPITIP
jgi:hypothetical protein